MKKLRKRRYLHSRKIECHGYLREDDLWDIEATLTDTKPEGYANYQRPAIAPDDPVHDMRLTVTLNLDREIKAVSLEMPKTPFAECQAARLAIDKLIGLKLGSGWMREARKRISRLQSCTHVMELLGPVSTTAYQTMHSALEARENVSPGRTAPAILDQCVSLSRSSQVVKVLWPDFYQGSSGKS